MKSIIIVTVTCFVTVFGNPLVETEIVPPNVKMSMKNCLIGYNIDPVILESDTNLNDKVYANLPDEKKGCITACVYRSFNWLRPDGSLNIDQMVEADTPEETEAEKKKYLKYVSECRNEHPKDDCKFFHCLDFKET